MSAKQVVTCDACGSEINAPKEKVAILQVPLPERAPKMEGDFFHTLRMFFGSSARVKDFHLCVGCAYGIVASLANADLRREMFSLVSDKGPKRKSRTLQDEITGMRVTIHDIHDEVIGHSSEDDPD